MRQFLLRLFIVVGIASGIGYNLDWQTRTNEPLTAVSVKEQVLGVADSIENMIFRVNIPARFDDTVTFGKPISAPNLIEELLSGAGIKVDGNKISNTGILTLAAGTGITIDGNKVTNSGITSLAAGTGISVSGSTITNTGITSLTAGTGISVSGSTITNTLDLSGSGWTDSGTTLKLTTITDSVGIGIAAPTSTLHVVGTSNLAGDVTLGANSSNSVTILGSISAGSSIIPATDLGADLGSTSKRFNNLWVANINSNSSQAFSGQTTFSYAPTDTTLSQASVIINPTTSAASGQLLYLGVAGYQKALIDEDGDIILGYSDATSAPASDYPLNIYSHSGTRVAYVDTSGNIVASGSLDINGLTNDIAGALNLSGSSLTSSGALTITPLAGSNLNVALSTTGDFAVNTNQLYVDTSAGYVGIGTTAPGSELEIYSADSTLSGVKFSSSTAGTNYSVGVGDGSPFNDALIFVANATQYAFMNSSGNWGYGFAGTPGSRISVSGGLSLGSSYVSTAAPTDGAIIQGNVGIGTTAPTSQLHVSGAVTGKALAIFDETGNQNILTASASGTTRLVLTNAGSLGIGTTAPSYKLQVNQAADSNALRIYGYDDMAAKYGDLYVDASGYTNLVGSDRLYVGATNYTLFTYGGTNIAWLNGTTSMDFFDNKSLNWGNDNDFKILYDETTDDRLEMSDGTNMFLTVKDQGTASDFAFNTDDLFVKSDGMVGIGTTAPIYALDVKAAGTGVIARFNSDNTSGCTVADGGTITCTSDRSLKKNILELNYGLADVMKLSPVAFNWNFDGDDKTKSLGFIAQDVEQIIPGLVTTDASGLRSLNTIGLVPVLAKAIQEQQLQIDEIKLSTASATVSNGEWATLVELVNLIKLTIEEMKTKFTTKESHQEKLCVGTSERETCVTQEQLDTLIKLIPTPTATQSGGQASPSPTPSIEPSPESSSSATSSGIITP